MDGMGYRTRQSRQSRGSLLAPTWLPTPLGSPTLPPIMVHKRSRPKAKPAWGGAPTHGASNGFIELFITWWFALQTNHSWSYGLPALSWAWKCGEEFPWKGFGWLCFPCQALRFQSTDPPTPAIYKRIPLHDAEDQSPYGCGVALCKAIQALAAFCGGSTPPWSELCFFFFASIHQSKPFTQTELLVACLPFCFTGFPQNMGIPSDSVIRLQ